MVAAICWSVNAVLRHDNMSTTTADDDMPTRPAENMPLILTGRGAVGRIVYTGDEAAAEIKRLIQAVVSPIKHACGNGN